MPSRRSFIQGTLAASALAASPLAARIDLAAPYKLLFERDLDAGPAFGAAAARLGARAEPAASDLGSLWMRELEPMLRTAPASIAGFTRGAPLFCLEVLARDYGLRSVYRIEHRRRADGGIEHRVAGSGPCRLWQDALGTAAGRWPATAAEIVVATAHRLRPGLDLALLEIEAPCDPEAPLAYTWLLAADANRRAVLAPRYK
jgi:hypothetical protein